MFRHPRGGIVVSTFSGENSTFGQDSMEKGWTYLKNELNKITPVRLVIVTPYPHELTPSDRFILFPHSLLTHRVIIISPLWTAHSTFVVTSSAPMYHFHPDFVFSHQWNGGWPLQLHAGMGRHDIQNYALDSDYGHLDNLGNSRTFMGAVSPWFFTVSFLLYVVSFLVNRELPALRS